MADDEKYTPAHALKEVRKFGIVVLDPATPEHNPVNALAFFTKVDDGLKQSWSAQPGLVFLNPPYSRGDGMHVGQWVEKCALEGEKKGMHVISLLSGDTSTSWWQAAFRTAAALNYYPRRIPFVNGSEEGRAGAKFCSHFFYWGKSVKRFVKAFEGVGITIDLQAARKQGLIVG